jgi:hypothetical protein
MSIDWLSEDSAEDKNEDLPDGVGSSEDGEQIIKELIDMDGEDSRK